MPDDIPSGRVPGRYKVFAKMRDWFVPPIVIPAALFLFIVLIAVFHT
jgi:hypothetical protein